MRKDSSTNKNSSNDSIEIIPSPPIDISNSEPPISTKFSDDPDSASMEITTKISTTSSCSTGDNIPYVSISSISLTSLETSESLEHKKLEKQETVKAADTLNAITENMNNIEADDSETSSGENDVIEDIPLAKKYSQTPSASSSASIESSKSLDVSKHTENHGIAHNLTAPAKEIVASFSNSTNLKTPADIVSSTQISTVPTSTEAPVPTVKSAPISSKTHIAEVATSSSVTSENSSNNARDEFFSSFNGSTPAVSSTEIEPITPTLGYTTKTAKIEIPNSLTDSVAVTKPEELTKPSKCTSTITDSITTTVSCLTSDISTTLTSTNIIPNGERKTSGEESVYSLKEDVTQLPPDPQISTTSSSLPIDAGNYNDILQVLKIYKNLW